MRAMWSEFPNEKRFWDVATQFMFGSSILVAPKLTRPKGVYEHMHLQEVTYALPENETWFNYYSKREETGHEWTTVALPDLQQAVFVRGGTILPILLHDNCISLIPCMRNDVRLEVYPGADQEAAGSLYLDDGASFEYLDQEAQSARIAFTFKNGSLSAAFEHGSQYADLPRVSTVVIFGVNLAPQSVTSTDGSQELSFVYEASLKALYIKMAPETTVNEVSVKITN